MACGFISGMHLSQAAEVKISISLCQHTHTHTSHCAKTQQIKKQEGGEIVNVRIGLCVSMSACVCVCVCVCVYERICLCECIWVLGLFNTKGRGEECNGLI